MNREIPLKFRLIAAGLHAIGLTSLLLMWLLSQIFFMFTMPVFDRMFLHLLMPIVIIILPIIITWIGWRITRQIHPFIDRSGRDAVNCALNTLLGTIASILFCTFVFSVTCGIGNQDPTLFFISLFILCCVELAYFINSVDFGIFALNGYDFKSRLIYPFLKDD